MKNRYVFILITCVFGAVMLSGCATTRKIPIKLHPEFASKGIDTIVFLPVVDRRIDKKGAVNLEDLRVRAKKLLEKKGYTVITPDVFSKELDVTAEDVGEMDIEDLSMLGPKDSRALLLLYVEDVIDEYVVLAYTFKIEATGSLIEKHEKLELWRDKGIGREGQGGLISGITAGMDKTQAIDACISSIIGTLPDTKAQMDKNAAKKKKIKTVNAAAKEVGMESGTVLTPVVPAKIGM